MSLRNMIPAGLVLAMLAGCSGAATTTSTADEASVGFDANAPKSSCCHKDGESMDKAACEAKAAECAKECQKADATAPATNG